MLNIDDVNKAYLACGITELRLTSKPKKILAKTTVRSIQNPLKSFICKGFYGMIHI